MTNRTQTRIAILLLAWGLAGCDRFATPLPAAPSSTSQALSLRTFRDSVSGFITSDLRDVGEQILQLNTAGELIWTADGTRLPGYHVSSGIGLVSYIAGPICPQGCALEVRFGTKDGERRAYLTAEYGHYNPGTLVDIDVVHGVLLVTQTDVYPPGTFTLSGSVTERVSAGHTFVEDVNVSLLVGDGWREAKTDGSGFYEIPGLYDGNSRVSAGKVGYQIIATDVVIMGDTRFDFEIVRR